jgi:hypothetical protein
MFELNPAMREALADHERAFADSRLSPSANARIERALREYTLRAPRSGPGLLLAAGLFVVGLMPWSSVQCQAPRLAPGSTAAQVNAPERATNDAAKASGPVR